MILQIRKCIIGLPSAAGDVMVIRQMRALAGCDGYAPKSELHDTRAKERRRYCGFRFMLYFEPTGLPEKGRKPILCIRFAKFGWT